MEEFRYGALYVVRERPNMDSIVRALRGIDRRLFLQVGGFSSAHAGGAQFCVGDGSVRFISQNVNPATFKNLANRADGELPAGTF